nr:WhiB family transcriptional regulator [Janibacter sp. Soil728]
MAACEGEELETFFPVGSYGPALWQEQRAKAICAGCRVVKECLAYALRTGQDHGIWGGLTSQERRDLRR